MRNFFNLYINENVKLFKKKSTLVLVLLIILTLFASVGFTYLIRRSNSNSYSGEGSSSNWKDMAAQQLEYLKSDFNSSKNVGNGNTNGLKAQIEMYEYAIENDINYFYADNSYWKVEALNKLVAEKTALYDAIDNKYTDAEVKKMTDSFEADFNILKTSDFDKFIDNKIAGIEDSYKNKSISQSERDLSLESSTLTKKYQIGKNNDSAEGWKTGVLNDIVNSRRTLNSGHDSQTNAVLSVEDKQTLNDKITVNLYRLENNLPPDSSFSSYNISSYKSVYEGLEEALGMSFIGILIIVVAGGAISQEMSKGTIKFLVITPSKRWKILLSKILTYLMVLVVFTVIISLLTVLVGNIFFGGYQSTPYIYVSNGQIHSVNHTVYEVLRFLTYDIDIIIYMLFVIMLSVITKNTAMAVGFSIAIYIGNSIMMSIVNYFVSSEWVKFIPFNNMNLTQNIFPNATSAMQVTDAKSMFPIIHNIPISFSLTVLGVCAILMLVSAFDSFVNKDIT